MIRLLGLYQDRSAARMAEMIEVLRRNLASDHLDEVHVFLEDHVDVGSIAELADPKVRVVPRGRRLTFQDLFAYANQELAGRRVIIANNDIYFDKTLARLDRYDLRGKMLCLSRWDVQPNGSAQLFNSCSSQDAWIFEAPLPKFAANWYLGLPGCENRLAYEVAEAGVTLENPSHTVRALHLHLSHVRNYVERQRLMGRGRVVHPSWLPGPWLWPIVSCMGRLDDVRANFGALLAQPYTTPVLVDYSCPDGAGTWMREHHPNAALVPVANRHWFNGAEAGNIGAANTEPDAVLCFLDPGVAVAPGFSGAILERFERNSFLIPDGAGPGLDSVLVCGRAAFDRVGGYDTNYHGWAEASADLRAVLRRAGLAERTFPSSLLTHQGHPPEANRRFHPLPDPELGATVDAAYRRLKDTIADEVGDLVPATMLREIHRAITQRHLAERGLVREAPCAGVAFQETMGYTVANLQPGVSSHNNEKRPFEEIPAPLAGLPFTQVVASRVSPVKVTFRGAGKLYVLVGIDWEGYHPAIAFLRERGYREPLPCVRTRCGTGFEVWSIVGQEGEVVELPTQVMLVARELVANGRPSRSRSPRPSRRSGATLR
jgi:hypothetical protein